MDLQTPALLLDENRLEANLTRMKARADHLGVALRPHLKTAKCAQVAKRALRASDQGLTVSTIAELEYFAREGFHDLTYAVGITPEKIARIAALQRDGAEITLILDSLEAAAGLAQKTTESDQHFRVLIEVDCGAHRGGVDPVSPLLLEIASALRDAERLTLDGVLSHAGHSYGAQNREEIIRIAEDERRLTVGAADMLRQAGHDAPVVSIGSTPTALFAESAKGVTEIRPGVYVFFDLFQAQLGCCETDDIAVSVLASVISRREDLGYCLIDAGALALSQDVSTQAHSGIKTYGLVCDAHTGAILGDLAVTGVHQEHGFVRSLSGDNALLPTPGTKLRILPNHSCMMSAPFERYHVINAAGAVTTSWPKTTGW